MEEKKTFSKAVETLKTNTAKVEQNYRQMKQDLTARNERVVELEQQNVELAAKAELVEQVAVQQQSAPTSQELDDASNENRTLKDHVNQLRTSVEVNLLTSQSKYNVSNKPGAHDSYDLSDIYPPSATTCFDGCCCDSNEL